MNVSKNKIVSIHFTVTDNEGIVVDSNLNFEPLQYLHGSGNLLYSLEQALAGAQDMEVRDIILDPKDAYGNYDENLEVKLDKKLFHEGVDDMQQGTIIQTPGGNEAELIDVLPGEIIVNGNHPLAGKRLHYKVTITGIRQATAKELISGSPHHNGEVCGPGCSC